MPKFEKNVFLKPFNCYDPIGQLGRDKLWRKVVRLVTTEKPAAQWVSVNKKKLLKMASSLSNQGIDSETSEAK